ncbi:MAG TPA: transcriptional regulator [Marinilabiliaceae bacterium]|nr:transcriptional regulator [Marinilabiliaceae bacterium]
MDWNSMSNSAVVQEAGKRIKELRLRKNLSQKQLAEQAGVSVFTVAQIEKGKSVSFVLFIAVIRVLRLLDNMELLLPKPEVSPIELLKLQTKKPRRAGYKKQ